MEALFGAEPCSGCAREPHRKFPVSWSPAFGAHLCTDCRLRYTDVELGVTERASLVADLRSGYGILVADLRSGGSAP